MRPTTRVGLTPRLIMTKAGIDLPEGTSELRTLRFPLRMDEVAMVRVVEWWCTDAAPSTTSSHTLLASLSHWDALPVDPAGPDPGSTAYCIRPEVWDVFTLQSDVHSTGGTAPSMSKVTYYPVPGFYIGGDQTVFFNGRNSLFDTTVTCVVFYQKVNVSLGERSQVTQETVWLSDPKIPFFG